PIASFAAGLKLRRSGPELVGPCPVCNDGDDRLQINVRKNVFFCRKCNPKGGGPIDFAIWRHGVDFRRAVEMLIGMNSRPLIKNGKIAKTDKTDHPADFDHEKRQAEKASRLWLHGSEP